ncbi:hypothetical protein BDZ97DRAFT_2060892 [Flammula alnicola]|nr:hypothetical protein BDZ97DRAFT_2060892 [Flammula alnicola]
MNSMAAAYKCDAIKDKGMNSMAMLTNSTRVFGCSDHDEYALRLSRYHDGITLQLSRRDLDEDRDGDLDEYVLQLSCRDRDGNCFSACFWSLDGNWTKPSNEPFYASLLDSHSTRVSGVTGLSLAMGHSTRVMHSSNDWEIAKFHGWTALRPIIGCEAMVAQPSFQGFRCRDCQDLHLFCEHCIVVNHSTLPFHHVQKWNGVYFEKTTLKALGLCVQLGHPDTNICPLPQTAFHDEFIVIDSDGIHEVSLKYCGCQQSLPKYMQLLRARLFPATTMDRRTAATFRVLKTFQMLSFTSKISTFEYYRSLARRTDNMGVSVPPDRYHAFLRTIREWRHVRLLKRMGRGHSDTGVTGTAEGELAVACPACPIADVNLPADWKSCPEKEQWLYSLFLSIDANFRLKRLNVSNDQCDPGLNHGYAYVVENMKFKKYLDEFNSKASGKTLLPQVILRKFGWKTYYQGIPGHYMWPGTLL